MVDFIEINTLKTLNVLFANPTTLLPIDPITPTVEVGYYMNNQFIATIPTSPLIKRTGTVGEYYRQVFLDPILYLPNQFFYVRYRGIYLGKIITVEDSFRTLSQSNDNVKKTQATLLATPKKAKILEAEFYVSVNSEITSRRAFLRGELLSKCDLWIELISTKTEFPTNAYQVSFDIEDLTDCSGICNSECGASLRAENRPAVNFGLGRYYADWQVDGDANPGPYAIHWDIKFTPVSPITRVSFNFHVVAKKNVYDLNFQNPFSPTAAN